MACKLFPNKNLGLRYKLFEKNVNSDAYTWEVHYKVLPELHKGAKTK